MTLGRFATGTATVLLVLAIATPTAVGVPPPPPNPSDSELDDGRAAATAQATRVGQLTTEVARAEAQLVALQDEVALALEEANKAMVDLRTAQDEATRARTDADAARRAADTAAADVEAARRAVDEFAASSYRQGSALGSVSAYLGATSPRDLLDRIELLNAVGASKLDALDRLDVARTGRANKDAAARAALARASAATDRAARAKTAADAATATARTARADQATETQRLQADKARAEAQLAAARSQASGLASQRQRYQDWLAAKQREDAANAQQAVAGGQGAVKPAAAPAARPIEVVIDRALSQVGVPYAWGGGDADGPTKGVRDGGVADAHGDYNKIGFDCSGLMIYAFAGAGIQLPHYSGYQHDAGTKVPLSQKRAGDMLFWASGGRIHHVALYLGNEQMVEAPYSGSRVRVTSVRYGGIVPNVTRLL